MSFSLKNHPFAVEAFFESSLVLTFAVDQEELKTYLPPCFELDTHLNQVGFIAVALVSTKNLRPKGFPNWMGRNFFLIGYRIFVRYITAEGKNLRGLYILKSETDKKGMAFFGNLFTHYHYSVTDINLVSDQNQIQISSLKSGIEIKAYKNLENTPLPINSPFKDWKEARRFAGPLPFTFTYHPHTNEVLLIEGVRQNWIPKPIEIESQSIDFIKNQNFKTAQLANAFMVENIPYTWKKGKLEIWKP